MVTSTEGEKSVLFISPEISKYCQNRTVELGMDATFKVVPRIGGAYQFFGVYLLLDGTVCVLFRTIEHSFIYSFININLFAGISNIDSVNGAQDDDCVCEHYTAAPTVVH